MYQRSISFHYGKCKGMYSPIATYNARHAYLNTPSPAFVILHILCITTPIIYFKCLNSRANIISISK